MTGMDASIIPRRLNTCSSCGRWIATGYFHIYVRVILLIDQLHLRLVPRHWQRATARQVLILQRHQFINPPMLFIRVASRWARALLIDVLAADAEACLLSKHR